MNDRKTNIYIQGIGSYVPPKSVSNQDLSKKVDTSDEWIFSHTGIKNRHIASAEDSTSDLAVNAVNSLLEKCGLDK
ncbi:MAG: 3-oxoacyl-ACP synthase, partial [Sphaerochaetaceae bacterium]|nr:3-oxoacyl-ACP synthase [Sphaerochaetaceae bacterium]